MTRLPAILAASLLAGTGAALAQAWPSKPVRLIVPNSPGASPDVVARMLAAGLSSSLGRSFVVDNRPGGQGVVAATSTAHATPDGHTIFQAGSNLVSGEFQVKSLGYDVEKDFTPIAMVSDSAPLVLAVPVVLGIGSVRDLVALAKREPGRHSYAAPGTLNPILGQWLMKVAGADMALIPYKDTKQSIQDTLANRTQLVVTAYPTVEGLVKAGKMRLLAVSSGHRFPGLDVPTIAETYPGLELAGWFALVGPAGVSPEIVQRLNRETDVIVKDPEFQKRVNGFGFSAAGAQTPLQLGEFIRAERARWRIIAKDLNLQPQ
jgi:tripartite-type tricarboxylate transporter receptor subunit TctC